MHLHLKDPGSQGINECFLLYTQGFHWLCVEHTSHQWGHLRHGAALPKSDIAKVVPDANRYSLEPHSVLESKYVLPAVCVRVCLYASARSQSVRTRFGNYNVGDGQGWERMIRQTKQDETQIGNVGIRRPMLLWCQVCW